MCRESSLIGFPLILIMTQQSGRYDPPFMEDQTELRQVVKQSQDSNPCLPHFKSHAHTSTTKHMILLQEGRRERTGGPHVVQGLRCLFQPELDVFTGQVTSVRHYKTMRKHWSHLFLVV